MIACFLLFALLYSTTGQGLNSSNLTTTTKWTRSTSKQQDFKCPYEPECSCTLKELECKKFENFKQLDFRRTSSTQQNELIFETIRIMAPKRQELAEDSLDLKGLNIASSGVVELHNISSFFYRANPLKNLNAQRNTIILKIIDSRFQFMLEQNIPLNSRCDWLLIKDNEENMTYSRNHSLMSTANMIELNSVEFPEPICPFIFNNLKIASLRVSNPIGSGQFKFLPVKIDEPKKKVTYYRKEYEISALGALIKSLAFKNLTMESIDKNVINQDVFAGTETIRFENVRGEKIEPNVFPNLNYLKELHAYFVNWKDLVDRVELKWMYDLNKYAPTVNDFKNITAYSKSKFSLFIDFGSYSLPDEDYCKFVSFPLPKYVVPYIRPSSSLACNCVLTWLLQHHREYPKENDFVITSGKYDSCDSDIALVNRCNVTRSKNHCVTYYVVIEEEHEKIFSIRNLTLIAILATILVIGGILAGVFIRNVRRRREAINRHQQAACRTNQSENAEMANFI